MTKTSYWQGRGKWLAVGLVSLWLATLLSACSLQREAEPRWLVLLTTKELDESGLLEAIIPPFEQQSGLKVKRLPLATATALGYADKAGIDLILLPGGPALDQRAGPSPTFPAYQPEPFPTPTPNAGPSEIAPPLPGLLYNERRLAFWSQLVLVAPLNDPLGLSTRPDAVTGLKVIATTNSKFYGPLPASEPGLATLEQRLWNVIGRFGPADRGSGYRQIEGDFEKLLKTAAQDGAYTLVPFSTFLINRNEIKDKLKIGFENDKALFLPYEIAVPNNSPPQNQDRDVKLARSFVAFLTNQTGQSIITKFSPSGQSSLPYRPYYFPVFVAPL